MQNIVTYTNALIQLFLELPILTQWAVVILLVVAFIVHVFAYNERTVHDAPSIFTTAGIFFTFVGIAEGLINFDPQKPAESVPALLSGLRTAFIASIFGVGIALTIKLRFTFFGVKSRDANARADGATVDDLHNQLIAVQQSLVGDDDSTLLSQLKLTRNDLNDRLDALRRSQAEFMQKMAADNSKALIEALQEVIRDFNAKISEQFGENFKRLNEAVGQLLVWQERYRLQLTEMIGQQTTAAQNMQTATERYSELVEKADAFAAISNQLSGLLGALNEQRSQIEATTKSLGQLLVTASSSLPQIEKKILDLTNQMTFSVELHQKEVTKALSDGSAALVSSVSDVKRLMLEATQMNNQETNAHIKQLAERTNEQIVKLDVALEKELTKALSTLASQLTSLSRQFVEDYGPLTERLREVVRLAGGKQS